jgi:hypothetical protein
LYPAIKIKFIGEDEITEEDIAAWKAERKERLKAQEEARRQAELVKNQPPAADDEKDQVSEDA